MNHSPASTTLVELPSSWEFSETLKRVQRAILEHGLLVIATIDHAAMAKNAGLHMEPATVIIYGHPKGGTALMNAVPVAALDLPLRVLVRQTSDKRTVIAFHPIVELLAADGVPEALSKALQPAQQLLASALST